MARWEPDAADRLRRAAIELYDERGYDETTVAEIAQRAGLTKRTYFRHFADKREVLFAGSERLLEAVIATVAAAPPHVTPLDAVVDAFKAADREFFAPMPAGVSAQRARIIASSGELQEREMVKLAGMAESIADTLVARDVPRSSAVLAGWAGVTIFHVAFGRWVRADGDRRSLSALLDDVHAELHAASEPAVAVV